MYRLDNKLPLPSPALLLSRYRFCEPDVKLDLTTTRGSAGGGGGEGADIIISNATRVATRMISASVAVNVAFVVSGKVSHETSGP